MLAPEPIIVKDLPAPVWPGSDADTMPRRGVNSQAAAERRCGLVGLVCPAGVQCFGACVLTVRLLTVRKDTRVVTQKDIVDQACSKGAIHLLLVHKVGIARVVRPEGVVERECPRYVERLFRIDKRRAYAWSGMWSVESCGGVSGVRNCS